MRKANKSPAIILGIKSIETSTVLRKTLGKIRVPMVQFLYQMDTMEISPYVSGVSVHWVHMQSPVGWIFSTPGSWSSVDKMCALLSRPALGRKQWLKSMLQTIKHIACSSPWRPS